MNTGGVFDSHITEWNCGTELPGGLSGGYLKARMGIFSREMKCLRYSIFYKI